MARARMYEPEIKEAAARHGADARLLWAIAYLETRFNPALVSRKGARGMMQFMPATTERFGLRDPHNPVAAIDAAAKYVRFLANRFGNRADLMLAAYNSGEATVEAYRTGRSIQVGDQLINPKGLITGGIPPFRETRGYVERGLKLLSSIPQLRPITSETLAGDAINIRNSLVRRSLRADGEQRESGIGQERSGQAMNRRSIYFGRQGGQE
ncbi:MAG: lytic transglycosylase domain-containing protein [Blastocatellia bacterium]